MAVGDVCFDRRQRRISIVKQLDAVANQGSARGAFADVVLFDLASSAVDMAG